MWCGSIPGGGDIVLIEKTMNLNRYRSSRERGFHDNWAAETPLAEIKVYEAFEHLAAQENRFILSLMGDVSGLKILDVGAGLGESSVYFALKDAKVTAIDLSPLMLKRCVALGEEHGVDITTLLGEADRFDYGANRFDIAYGANILHHLGDIPAFLHAVHRALVPGGRFFFFDPLGYNPAIQIYRRLATKVRTEDERPFRFTHLNIFQEIFSETHHREFWLTSLLLFFKYFLVDRVHPNADRYWKKIFKEDPEKIGWWFKPLLKLDKFLLGLPLFPYLAWNMVVWGKK